MSEFKVEHKAINLYLDDDCIYFGKDGAEAFKVFKKDDILGEIFQQNVKNGTVELIQYFKDASSGLSWTRTVIVKSSCTCHGKILKNMVFEAFCYRSGCIKCLAQLNAAVTAS